MKKVILKAYRKTLGEFNKYIPEEIQKHILPKLLGYPSNFSTCSGLGLSLLIFYASKKLKHNIQFDCKGKINLLSEKEN